MRMHVVAAALAGSLLFAGCSGGPVPSDDASSSPAAAPAAAATTPAAPRGQVGQTLSDRGATVTVKAVRAVDSIDMNESGIRAGSGYERYTKTRPDAGGKFVVIETHVENTGGVSMDLTCSLPITTRVADTQDRNFDPIRDLYKIKGNPECNKNLQPGFSAEMTYVYMVPATATVVRWGFYDSTEITGHEKWFVFDINA